VVRASAAPLIGGQQFERTAALIDLSEQDSYLVDVFRVVGGSEHVKFVHSHFGRIDSHGLTWRAREDHGWGEQTRNVRQAVDPPRPWSVDWIVDDYLHYLPAGQQVRLRYTDLTPDAEVLAAEGWVAVGLYGGTADAWIPRLAVRRRADQAPLASTFVSLIEPYETSASIARVTRLPLETADGQPCRDSDVAIEMILADGRRDVLLALDVEDPLGTARRGVAPVIQPTTGIRLDGQFGLVRFDQAGAPQRAMLCLGTSLAVGERILASAAGEGFVEVDCTAETPRGD
jgi:hypothetical protein